MKRRDLDLRSLPLHLRRVERLEEHHPVRPRSGSSDASGNATSTSLPNRDVPETPTSSPAASSACASYGRRSNASAPSARSRSLTASPRG
jgi:hypothetical protein